MANLNKYPEKPGTQLVVYETHLAFRRSDSSSFKMATVIAVEVLNLFVRTETWQLFIKS